MENISGNIQKKIEREFFARETLLVARELLGKKIVRKLSDGKILSGMVIETEAYMGTNDSASHAFKGKTERNAVMFGPPGFAYIYLVYGMYYLLNIVTEKKETPCSVLLRAIVPLEGISQMEQFRAKKGKDLTNGPAKLCQAMAIDKNLNKWDITCGKQLWFEDYQSFSPKQICTGPRLGINYAKQEDRESPWRFWIKVPKKRNPKGFQNP